MNATVQPLERGLAVVFGQPGPMTIAAVETLQAIVDVVLRDSAVEEVNTRDDWDRACSQGRHFIAISQYPSPEFRAYVGTSAIPSILVVDDPLHAVAHLVADQLSDINAVRAVSTSVSCLAGMLARSEPEVQSLNARNLAVFLHRLAQASGIDLGAADMERIELQAIELSGKLDSICRHRYPALPSNGSGCALAVAALPQLRDLPRLDEGVRLVWPGPSFLLGDFPDTPMRKPVDLSGPARCLLYGPYLHLPAGEWTALLALDLSGHDGVQSFAIDVVCGDVIALGRFETNGAGLFEAQIGFAHCNPHVPIELRLFLETGAIYGRLDGFEVGLECHTSAPTLVPEQDFAGPREQ